MKIVYQGDKKEVNRPFPKLMKNGYGAITLFFDETSGVILVSADKERIIPVYSDFLLQDSMENREKNGKYKYHDYEGTVCLSNEDINNG